MAEIVGQPWYSWSLSCCLLGSPSGVLVYRAGWLVAPIVYLFFGIVFLVSHRAPRLLVCTRWSASSPFSLHRLMGWCRLAWLHPIITKRYSCRALFTSSSCGRHWSEIPEGSGTLVSKSWVFGPGLSWRRPYLRVSIHQLQESKVPSLWGGWSSLGPKDQSTRISGLSMCMSAPTSSLLVSFVIMFCRLLYSVFSCVVRVSDPFTPAVPPSRLLFFICYDLSYVHGEAHLADAVHATYSLRGTYIMIAQIAKKQLI